MSNYDIKIMWKKGKEMHLADMLSRAYLPDSGTTDEFAQVNMLDYVAIGPERLRESKKPPQVIGSFANAETRNPTRMDPL